MSISPDQVLFTLEVITINKDLIAAKTANDAGSAKVLAVARAHQVTPQDVQTVNLTVTPKYSTPAAGSGGHVFLGYEVTNRVIITLKALNKIESFLGDALSAGVNRVINISFENSQIRKYREQVRETAVKNAQEKARAYAQRLGQNIGKAYSITEEGAEGGVFGGGGGGGGGDNEVVDLAGAAGQSVIRREVTFAIGQIKIEERIIVSFLLE
jgi:uncharacterized protein YggE